MTSGRTVVIIFETVLINKTTGMRRMGDLHSTRSNGNDVTQCPSPQIHRDKNQGYILKLQDENTLNLIAYCIIL